MDLLELQTLADEVINDGQVAILASKVARLRFDESTPSGYESCAHHLSRLYNIIEQMGLRVARAFENNIEDEKKWHTELLNRLTLRIHGVRPPLFTSEVVQPMHELRAFRHVFVHAYDLRLDVEKLSLLLKYADLVAARLPGMLTTFIQAVALEQGLEMPQISEGPDLKA
jgi:hypothetical protein